MNNNKLSEHAPELFKALKNLLDEIPVIAGDSRHDELALRIHEADNLIHEITDEPELKPCPFCGGKAELRASRHCGRKVYGIFCTADLEQGYRHGHFIDNYGIKQEAIDTWNRRFGNEQVQNDRQTRPH